MLEKRLSWASIYADNDDVNKETEQELKVSDGYA
jgi:hypothetical protein